MRTYENVKFRTGDDTNPIQKFQIFMLNLTV